MRHLSRRTFLIAAGIAATPLAALSANPACTLTSEQEEGPYYIDDETLRRDITENRPGVPLILAVRLVDAKRCSPLRNAALDIWHCDALGVYSGFTAGGPDGGRGGPPGGRGRRPGGPPPSRQTDATRFLRGVQISDEGGLTEFSTVYPGWYSGRTIHIHGKVHIGGEAAKKYSGGHVAHTGQFFFPEDLTERISRLPPYAKRLDVERTTQTEDHVFNDQHGSACMLNIERLGKTDQEGFLATVTLAIDTEATPAAVDGFGGRGPGGPPPRFRG
jgi:protocatechuate 3,4-dioxygenase beta subunit